jgi:hypothetical protein
MKDRNSTITDCITDDLEHTNCPLESTLCEGYGETTAGYASDPNTAYSFTPKICEPGTVEIGGLCYLDVAEDGQRDSRPIILVSNSLLWNQVISGSQSASKSGSLSVPAFSIVTGNHYASNACDDDANTVKMTINSSTKFHKACPHSRSTGDVAVYWNNTGSTTTINYSYSSTHGGGGYDNSTFRQKVYSVDIPTGFTVSNFNQITNVSGSAVYPYKEKVCPEHFVEQPNGTCRNTYEWYSYSCPDDVNIYGHEWVLQDAGGDCGSFTCTNSPTPPEGNCIRQELRCPTDSTQVCTKIPTDVNSTHVNQIDGYQYVPGSAIEHIVEKVKTPICPSEYLHQCPKDEGWFIDREKMICTKPLEQIAVSNCSSTHGYIHDTSRDICYKDINEVVDFLDMVYVKDFTPEYKTGKIYTKECADSNLVYSNLTKKCEGDVDLNSWIQEGNSNSGNWVVNSNGTELLQTVNELTTLFLTPVNLSNVAVIEGEIKGNIEHYNSIGLAFGFQSNDNFYVVDWSNGWGETSMECSTAAGGKCLKDSKDLNILKITSSQESYGASGGHFYRDDTEIVTAVDGIKWIYNTWYSIKVELTKGNIKVYIKPPSQSDYVKYIDYTLPNGEEFQEGRAGFYNLSTPDVSYKGFKMKTDPVIVESEDNTSNGSGLDSNSSFSNGCQVSPVTVCSELGYELDPLTGKCIEDRHCDGIINQTTGKCESTPSKECSTANYNLDNTSSKCIKAPTCLNGELVMHNGEYKCSEVPTCSGAGWQYSQVSGKCEKELIVEEPVCPDSFLTLNTSTRLCSGYADFNEWSISGNPSHGSWSVQAGGSRVYQRINGSPTYFTSQREYPSAKLSGKICVQRYCDNWIDDDNVGLTFGYKSASKNLTVAWNNGGVSPSGVYVAQNGASQGSNNYKWSNSSQDCALDSANWHTIEVVNASGNVKVNINGTERLNLPGLNVPEKGRVGFYNYSNGCVSYKDFYIETEPVCSTTDLTYNEDYFLCYKGLLNPDQSINFQSGKIEKDPTCTGGGSNFDSTTKSCMEDVTCDGAGIFNSQTNKCEELSVLRCAQTNQSITVNEYGENVCSHEDVCPINSTPFEISTTIPKENCTPATINSCDGGTIDSTRNVCVKYDVENKIEKRTIWDKVENFLEEDIQENVVYEPLRTLSEQTPKVSDTEYISYTETPVYDSYDPWSYLSAEYQTINTSANYYYRYGHGSHWTNEYTYTTTQTLTCGNTMFGSHNDPIYGVVKACYHRPTNCSTGFTYNFSNMKCEKNYINYSCPTGWTDNGTNCEREVMVCPTDTTNPWSPVTEGENTNNCEREKLGCLSEPNITEENGQCKIVEESYCSDPSYTVNYLTNKCEKTELICPVGSVEDNGECVSIEKVCPNPLEFTSHDENTCRKYYDIDLKCPIGESTCLDDCMEKIFTCKMEPVSTCPENYIELLNEDGEVEKCISAGKCEEGYKRNEEGLCTLKYKWHEYQCPPDFEGPFDPGQDCEASCASENCSCNPASGLANNCKKEITLNPLATTTVTKKFRNVKINFLYNEFNMNEEDFTFIREYECGSNCQNFVTRIYGSAEGLCFEKPDGKVNCFPVMGCSFSGEIVTNQNYNVISSLRPVDRFTLKAFSNKNYTKEENEVCSNGYKEIEPTICTKEVSIIGEIKSTCQLNGNVGWEGRAEGITAIGVPEKGGDYVLFKATGSSNLDSSNNENYSDGFNIHTMAILLSNGFYYIADIEDQDSNKPGIPLPNNIKKISPSFYSFYDDTSNYTCKINDIDYNACSKDFRFKLPEENLEVKGVIDIDTLRGDGFQNNVYDLDLSINKLTYAYKYTGNDTTSGTPLNFNTDSLSDKLTVTSFDELSFFNVYKDGEIGKLEFVRGATAMNSQDGFLPEILLPYNMAYNDFFSVKRSGGHTYFFSNTLTTEECNNIKDTMGLTDVPIANKDAVKHLGYRLGGCNLMLQGQNKSFQDIENLVKIEEYSSINEFRCSPYKCNEKKECGITTCPTDYSGTLIAEDYYVGNNIKDIYIENSDSNISACQEESCDVNEKYISVCGFQTDECIGDGRVVRMENNSSFESCQRVSCPDGSIINDKNQCESLKCPPNTIEQADGSCRAGIQ